MSDNVSIFNRYAPKAAEAKPSGKEAYRAADMEVDGLAAHRLRIDYSNGDVGMFLYGNLISVYASGGAISLMFTSGVVYLEGDNLNELLDGLHDERIRTLRAFNENRHISLGSGDVTIRLMEYQSIDQVMQ